MTIRPCYRSSKDRTARLAFYDAAVPAGFPSPAQDHVGDILDLSAYLIRHPEATYFVRAQGDSMVDAGIFDGDLLIVDRALEPEDGSIVIAAIDGEFTVKRLRIHRGVPSLMPENFAYPMITLRDGQCLELFGVVAHVIHSFVL
jgi:DNA polymerase V